MKISCPNPYNPAYLQYHLDPNIMLFSSLWIKSLHYSDPPVILPNLNTCPHHCDEAHAHDQHNAGSQDYWYQPDDGTVHSWLGMREDREIMNYTYSYSSASATVIDTLYVVRWVSIYESANVWFCSLLNRIWVMLWIFQNKSNVTTQISKTHLSYNELTHNLH